VGFDSNREQLLAVGVERDARIEALAAQVAALTARLGQNSGNSSLPPSSDRFAKPFGTAAKVRRAGRESSRARRGGLALVADPSEVALHFPTCCAGCGADLGADPDVQVLVRQARDVTLVKATVTEAWFTSGSARVGR